MVWIKPGADLGAELAAVGATGSAGQFQEGPFKASGGVVGARTPRIGTQVRVKINISDLGLFRPPSANGGNPRHPKATTTHAKETK